MCGLVGIAAAGKSSLSAQSLKMFEDLLYIDTLRGPHSTGVIAITDKHNWYAKLAVDGPTFLQDSMWLNLKEEMKGEQIKLLAGHNRYATKGEVNQENAHPFITENLMFMHNGTLHDYEDLDDHDVHEVDSQVLAHSVDKIGLEETLAMVRGAYALTYYNTTTLDMTFARNHDRPLWLSDATIGGVKATVWASEGDMIRLVTGRKTKGVHSVTAPQPLKPHTYITMNMGGMDIKMGELPKGKSTPAPTYASHRGYSGNVADYLKPTKSFPKKVTPVVEDTDDGLLPFGLEFGQYAVGYFTEFRRYNKTSKYGSMWGYVAIPEEEDYITELPPVGNLPEMTVASVIWFPFMIDTVEIDHKHKFGPTELYAFTLKKGPLEAGPCTDPATYRNTFKVDIRGTISSGDVEATIDPAGDGMVTYAGERVVVTDIEHASGERPDKYSVRGVLVTTFTPLVEYDLTQYESDEKEMLGDDKKKGANGSHYTEEEYNDDPRHVCCSCNERLDFHKTALFEWTYDYSYALCETCADWPADGIADHFGFQGVTH